MNGELFNINSLQVIFALFTSIPILTAFETKADDPNARARAITWMFAALNTVEPPIVERAMAILVERDKPWHAERLAVLESRVRAQLGELSSRLGNARLAGLTPRSAPVIC